MNIMKKNEGLGMVEIVVVIALILTGLVSVLQLATLEKRAQNLAKEQTGAYLLARECLESIRTVRDESWDSIALLVFATPYYPEIINNNWELSASSSGNIGIYSRQVTFSEVFRDANDDIADSGISDSDTRLATCSVSWGTAGGSNKTIQLQTYLTNWRNYQ